MKASILSTALALFIAAAAQAEKPAPAQPKQPPATGAAKAPVVKNVTAAEADKLTTDRKDIVVLDVRTDAEFEEGHIAGAKNVSFIDPEFEQQLKMYEGKPVVVHCAAGSRSAKALAVMKKYNFPEIYHLESGIKGWKEAGKDLVKTPKPPGAK